MRTLFPCLTGNHMTDLSVHRYDSEHRPLSISQKAFYFNFYIFGYCFVSFPFVDALASLKTMLDIKSFSDIFNISRLQNIREYCRVLQSIRECYRVLQSVTECYRVLQSVTECYRVLQSIKEYYREFKCYRVLQSLIECHRVLQSVTDFLQCIAEYYRILQSIREY